MNRCIALLLLIMANASSVMATEYRQIRLVLDPPATTGVYEVNSDVMEIAANETVTWYKMVGESVGANWIPYFSVGAFTNPFSMVTGEVVEGPAKIWVRCWSTLGTAHADKTAIFKIQRTDSLLTPTGAIVIPADDGGPVTIALESSVDLVHWTDATPGTYGTSETRRFFRLRATRSAP